MKKIMPLVLLTVALAAFTAGTMLTVPVASEGVGEPVVFKGGCYCVCKNSDECNKNTPGADCQCNTVTSYGKNSTRDYLNTDGTREAFDVLALSNVTPVLADAYNFTQEMTGGLARAGATVTNWVNDGNWSLYHQWTADGQFLNVNTTGIFNDTNAGMGPMLCAGTFTSVNLEDQDTLSINYTLWIT